MHIVQSTGRQRVRRRMYLPSERMVVSGVGLGELDGMFNIGKMFTRMFTVRKSSFKAKNIAGAIGSVVTTTATMGIANIASGGKLTSARSKTMQHIGYGTMAAAAAAGMYFGGSALLSAVGTGAGTAGSAASTAAGTAASTAGTAAASSGGILSTIGSGVMKLLPMMTSVMSGMGGGSGSGGGGGEVMQSSLPAEGTYPMLQQSQQQAYQNMIAQQQAEVGLPVSYGGAPSMTGMNASYGDLRSPYVAVAEDGSTVEVDPRTGQPMVANQATGMHPKMMLGIGGLTLLVGWYLFSGSKSTN